MLRSSAPLRASFRRRPARSTAPATPPLLFSRRAAPQLAFAVGGVGLALGTAAYLTNHDTLARSPASALSDPNTDSGLFGSWRRRLTTGLSPTLARQRADEALTHARDWVRALGGAQNRLAVIAAENWLEAGEARRTALGLVASFAGVWIAWRLPARFNVGRWWAHDALSGKSATILTSTFSHRVRPTLSPARPPRRSADSLPHTQTLPHLVFNSLALYSFTTATFSFLDSSDVLPRSTSKYEYLALFVSAGLVSGVASHVWFSRVVAGRLLRQYGAKATREAIVPSLGASGALSLAPRRPRLSSVPELILCRSHCRRRLRPRHPHRPLLPPDLDRPHLPPLLPSPDRPRDGRSPRRRPRRPVPRLARVRPCGAPGGRGKRRAVLGSRARPL